MKKLINTIFGLSIVATMIACGAAEKKTEEVAEEPAAVEEAVAETKNINLEESTVLWSGSVLGAYSHTGTLAITEGTVEMTGDAISGGSFTVNMATITPTDSGYTEDHSAEMLVGHLASADFFLIDSFPTANFVIKSVDNENGNVTGDLTIKGISNEAVVENISAKDGILSGTLTFDRQKYGVAYVSTMKDMVISDDIELEISLKM